jgi:hypothetical protein
VIPEPRRVFLEFVSHEEYVDLDDHQTPIEGSRTAFLQLKDSNDRMVRAEIPHADLDRLLALMFPDFDGRQST